MNWANSAGKLIGSLILTIVLSLSIGGSSMAEIDWKALPRADFKWKSLCVSALGTSEEIKEMVDLAHDMLKEERRK